MATPSHHISSERPIAKYSYRRVEGSRSVRKTPQEVLSVLHRQGRQTVCMKYLSQMVVLPSQTNAAHFRIMGIS
ncbi:hypothetical protein PHMEG_00020431 [Phytophthora megakarya]|uniref:Uncharacterized protein n=1 Tax=Phytophthora megakarya TaxID=4795 RepID=A0A225VPE2_9STRA|nr:hypothetical protein PHMEG_00020431 [Phytophthora megakarya]